jgi:hypothetical protein
MKKKLNDFKPAELARPECIKGGDGSTISSATSTIIIIDESVGRG